MKIVLENIGRRFGREWIFRKVNHTFSTGEKHSVLGTNGSGKSTLLQIIAGSVSPSEGKIILDNLSTPETIFRSISYAAPYLELAEEMTWREAIRFQGKFKNYISGLDEEKIIELSGLQASSEKQIRNFSSGMKQRARLALAILADTPILLLDEPSTNLDANAVNWYAGLIEKFAKGKLVIVCSNYNKEEYSFCTKELALKQA